MTAGIYLPQQLTRKSLLLQQIEAKTAQKPPKTAVVGLSNGIKPPNFLVKGRWTPKRASSPNEREELLEAVEFRTHRHVEIFRQLQARWGEILDSFFFKNQQKKGTQNSLFFFKANFSHGIGWGNSFS